MDLLSVLQTVIQAHTTPGGNRFEFPTHERFSFLGHNIMTGGRVAGTIISREDVVEVVFEAPVPRLCVGACVVTVSRLEVPRNNQVVRST